MSPSIGTRVLCPGQQPVTHVCQGSRNTEHIVKQKALKSTHRLLNKRAVAGVCNAVVLWPQDGAGGPALAAWSSEVYG
eukprot:scaffold26281_cov23-Tisochrysis_lutea.AAC.4